MPKNNMSAYNSDEYDGKVRFTLPYYNEFHNQVTDIVSTINKDNIKWLDTGCGTGTLACKVIETVEKNIDFTLCDISTDMLEIAQGKLKGHKNVTFRNVPSQNLDYKDEFDVVSAVQSHHYLSVEERKKAVLKCFDALVDGGAFIVFENIKFADKVIDDTALKRWGNFMIKNGRTEEHVQKHMARRGTEIFPITVKEHLSLLKECGFRSVDLVWLSYMQAGFIGIK